MSAYTSSVTAPRAILREDGNQKSGQQTPMPQRLSNRCCVVYGDSHSEDCQVFLFCDIVRRKSNTSIGTEERPCEIAFATAMRIPMFSAMEKLRRLIQARHGEPF
jgi:hypothetical protein